MSEESCPCEKFNQNTVERNIFNVFPYNFWKVFIFTWESLNIDSFMLYFSICMNPSEVDLYESLISDIILFWRCDVMGRTEGSVQDCHYFFCTCRVEKMCQEFSFSTYAKKDLNDQFQVY